MTDRTYKTELDEIEKFLKKIEICNIGDLKTIKT